MYLTQLFFHLNYTQRLRPNGLIRNEKNMNFHLVSVFQCSYYAMRFIDYFMGDLHVLSEYRKMRTRIKSVSPLTLLVNK